MPDEAKRELKHFRTMPAGLYEEDWQACNCYYKIKPDEVQLVRCHKLSCPRERPGSDGDETDGYDWDLERVWTFGGRDRRERKNGSPSGARRQGVEPGTGRSREEEEAAEEAVKMVAPAGKEGREGQQRNENKM
jgi:hypothetical protein